MDQPKNVRARGRARQAREQARRPGEEPERGGTTAQPAAVHPQQGNGGGRRTHRGAPRVDPVPSQERPPPQVQMEGVTEAMASASVSDFPSGRGRSRDGPGNDFTRPSHVTDKRGESGKPIQLVTNYFELKNKPEFCIYQYHCDFAPLVESSRMRRGMLREHKETFGTYLFDGMSDLKTAKQLGESLELFSKRITDGENIRITLKRVNELAPSHPELQRLFNTQMRNNLRYLNFQQLGRYLFDPQGVHEVEQHNLQIWQGVVTSIRQHETSVLMCVDTVHKVVRRDTALQLIQTVSKDQRGNYKDNCLRELVGCVVMTRYKNSTYRVEDIDWSLNPSSTFDRKGEKISYADYLKQQYDVTVRDMLQPLLLATSKEREIRMGASASKKIYLVPELCAMTGLTESMRSNFTTMKELGNLTRVAPDRRVQYLNSFVKRLNGNEKVSMEMGAWGLAFANNLVELTGRIVPPEKICMRMVEKEVPQDRDFTVFVRSDPMHVSLALQDWLVLCTGRDRDRTNEMLSMLAQVSRNLDMQVRKPKLIELRDDRINSYLSAFRENFIPGSTQLVMFILPNNKKERYDALKKQTYVDNAVPSQVVLSRTIGKPKGLMTVATKIAIQLNCKLGGVPWAVKIPIKGQVMVCGYDTYHDCSRKGHSAGAFVASLDKNCTRWYSKVNFHKAGAWQELSDHMRINFTAALRRFQKVNNCLPDTILVYRDGVGDGQVRYVREWEIQQLKAVISDNFQAKPVRFGFIIVNKKINTRFFRVHDRSYTNPPHGTVVDNCVTRYDRFDFFLVSQLATQGTVSPTQYNVIEDTTGLKPEYIQRLSYKLTHLYYNCTATISVPAPCQYAHKLAFLAGQSLHEQPREELCDKLFYL